MSRLQRDPSSAWCRRKCITLPVRNSSFVVARANGSGGDAVHSQDNSQGNDNGRRYKTAWRIVRSGGVVSPAILVYVRERSRHWVVHEVLRTFTPAFPAFPVTYVSLAVPERKKCSGGAWVWCQRSQCFSVLGYILFQGALVVTGNSHCKGLPHDDQRRHSAQSP